VVDSNVWVAAAINPEGLCGQLLLAALDGRWYSVVSPLLVEELTEVLRRDKFRRWLSLEEVELFVAGLVACCDVQPDPVSTPDPISSTRTTTRLSDLVPPVLTPSQFLGRISG
jgi:predicted nucleic acid-binding protein